MKKAIFFLFIFQLNHGLYCIEYVVLRRTPLYTYDTGSDVIRFLEPGKDVISNIDSTILLVPTSEIRISCSTNQGETGSVNADDIVLPDSDSIPVQIRNKKWIYSFYLDILKTGKKETLYNYEPFWRDEWGDGPEGSGQFPLVDWEDEYEPTLFFIKNSVMAMHYLYYFDSLFFLYSNVYTSNTSEVTIKASCYSKSSSYPQNYLNRLFEVEGEYTIILKPDGTYLDFFVDDKHICTLVAVDDIFIETIQKIIKGEDYNISEITWPRRADGSMDYPPPDGVQLADITEQPEIVTADTPPTEYEDIAAITPDQETVAQQPETRLPLVIALAVAGVLVAAGVVVFLVRRKK